MLRIDDSIFEYALYDMLSALDADTTTVLELAVMRSHWRMTGLRHTDLYTALELLTTAESLVAIGPGAWRLTEAGAERTRMISGEKVLLMADQVARSVLQTLKARVPENNRVPRPMSMCRRAATRVRVRELSRQSLR